VLENIKIVRKAMHWLSPNQKIRFTALVCLNASLALLDLIGITLFALLGTIAVRGFQSINLSPRTNEILKYLKLDGLDGQTVIGALAVAASVFLISKTLISIVLNRKTQVFLARTGAFASTKYIKGVLGNDLEILLKIDLPQLRFNATHGSRALFTGILGGFVTFITDGFLLVVMLVAVFISSPLVAIASTLLFATAAVTLHFIQRHKAFALGTESAKEQLQTERYLLAATEGFRELFVLGRIKRIILQIEEKFLRVAKINAEMAILPNVGKYVIEITLILGTLMVAAIQLSITDAARATSVMAVFLVAASRVAPALLRIQQGLLSVKANYGTAYSFISSSEGVREYEIQKTQLKSGTENKSEISPNHVYRDFTAEVNLKSVSFCYPGATKSALTDINLRITRGEKIALVGSSGSGKSTLVDLIVGLRAPDSGYVTISGLPPSEAIKFWPGKIGYAPQNTFLIEAGITDNIKFFKDDGNFDKDQIEKILRMLGLEERLFKEEGFLLEEPLSNELSGGEKQRVGLARTLYGDPSLLIIDEATSALDAKLENSIVGNIMNKENETTVLAISHRISTIKMASRILFMSAGKLTGDGNYEEVYEANEEFRHQIDTMYLKDND
jgi:ATP-binding cassette subfamily C protein